MLMDFEDAALAVTIAANVQRLDDDPILEAEAVERMEKGGMSREEIAAAIGKSVACVARRARLASLSRPWREFARRVPCTTDLLEKVAAHETQLQERVAADIGLDEYEYDGEGGERCPWGEFENTFDRAVMKISDAAFDASVCANCPNNTARHAYLFDFMASEDGDDARCQDPACYAKRNNAAVDALVERLRRGGTPAVEVADRWRIPEYWNASAKPGAKHRQAYVYTDGSLKRVRWSVPMPKPERAQSAMTDEEREAARRVKRAHNAWKKNRLAAYEKVRSALGDVETRRGFFRSVVRTEEFCDWAENYLERQAGTEDYIYDGFCQEMLRMANAKTLADWNVELTDEEIGAVTSEDPAIARDGEGGAESGE